MDRAERRRLDRALGIPTTKMKRKRPGDPAMIQAIGMAVKERDRPPERNPRS